MANATNKVVRKVRGLIAETIAWKLTHFFPTGATSKTVFAWLNERHPLIQIIERG